MTNEEYLAFMRVYATIQYELEFHLVPAITESMVQSMREFMVAIDAELEKRANM